MTTRAKCAMRDEEIVRRRQYGDAVADIARDLGIPFGTAAFVLHKRGVRVGRRVPRDVPVSPFRGPYAEADAILAGEEERIEAELAEVRRRLAWNAQWRAQK